MNKALMSIFTSLWLFSEYGFAQVREPPAPGLWFERGAD